MYVYVFKIIYHTSLLVFWMLHLSVPLFHLNNLGNLYKKQDYGTLLMEKVLSLSLLQGTLHFLILMIVKSVKKNLRKYLRVISFLVKYDSKP